MPEQTEKAFYIRGIPNKLKDKYKRLCEAHHIPMTEGISRLLVLVTDDDSPLWNRVLRMPPTARERKE